jgi:hypothetical protein
MRNDVRSRAPIFSFVLSVFFFATCALGHAQPPGSNPAFAAAKSPEPVKLPAVMPVSELKPGMRGFAYSVFEGTKPEKIDVEILGVLKNALGPKSDMILVRLHGAKVEYTGVVAGMSGSPVYMDGKLIGALSYRIGEFSKEPIAGVTPIESMLEINDLDRAAPVQSGFSSRPNSEVSQMSAGQPQSKSSGSEFARSFTPIAAPLVFSGFSSDTLQRFSSYFTDAGMMPVMGMGAASDVPQPEPIEPGSSVGIVLVRGDMDIAATCTVTYLDPQRLLACGHPIMQFGNVDMPMTKSAVVATLPSSYNAFKIATTTETVGAFRQDRHTGIMGRFGEAAQMVPVTLTIHGGPKPKQFHYEMLNNAKLTPVAMMATVYNALQSLNEQGEEVSYRMDGRIDVKGYPSVQMENMFTQSDAAPAAMGVALSIGDRFGRIYDNIYQTPDVQGVSLDFDLVRERRFASLESARTDVTEARPGDEVVIETVLRPYRGERVVRQIPVRIPTSTPKGNLRILISDGDTLERTRNVGGAFSRKLDLGSTIAELNKQRVSHRLYVSLLEANPQAMIEDKVMPKLPLSVMNVMDGMRGTHDMVVIGESAVNESSTPLDFVVAGAQVISLTIK